MLLFWRSLYWSSLRRTHVSGKRYFLYQRRASQNKTPRLGQHAKFVHYEPRYLLIAQVEQQVSRVLLTQVSQERYTHPQGLLLQSAAPFQSSNIPGRKREAKTKSKIMLSLQNVSESGILSPLFSTKSHCKPQNQPENKCTPSNQDLKVWFKSSAMSIPFIPFIHSRNTNMKLAHSNGKFSMWELAKST